MMIKDRCYGCFGASFGDCEECKSDSNDDLIKRSDALEALDSVEEISGYAYKELRKLLKAIPSK